MYRCFLHLLPWVWLLPLLWTIPACGGGYERVEPGTRVDHPERGPEMGPLEAEALSYLEEMAVILEAPAEDPTETVFALGRYLQDHQERILAVAAQIEEGVLGLSPAERVYYEERFSDYLVSAYQRWVAALSAFRGAHPEAARQVDGLMRHFD